jgi:anti-sigma factor RsiW
MKSETTLTCKELIDQLDDFVADALSPEQLEDFRLHLEECPDCVNYLDSYRKTIAAAQHALTAMPPSTPEASEEFVENFMSTIRRISTPPSASK